MLSSGWGLTPCQASLLATLLAGAAWMSDPAQALVQASATCSESNPSNQGSQRGAPLKWSGGGEIKGSRALPGATS